MARNWNPKYKINLINTFNNAYAGDSTELRNQIRPTISDDNFKVLYANKVITEIQDRTQRGLDMKGNKHVGYSKSYSESLEFKIFKGRKRIRDLTLTGDMLSDIQDTFTPFTIVFGFGDKDNRGKAQGHITGQLGKHGKAKPRPFFGLPKNLEEKLLRDSIIEFRQFDQANFADLFDIILGNTVV